MKPDPLPPELEELEKLLAGRPCPKPEAGLRGRLLAAVRNEPGRHARSPGARVWRYAWRAAAAVILALNLALSAANSLRYQALPVRSPDPANHLPDLDRAGRKGNDRLAAVAVSAVARLSPAPDVGPVGRLFFERRED
jgi:hypothetical protein